jgi:hypothetical protein
MNTLRLIFLTLLFAAVALAADVTGKWSAEMPGRGGNSRQMVITLKAEGNALTGTVSGPRGDTDIQDGKIDGENISFSVVREFNGNSFKLNYTGKVSGDEIHFKVSREGGNAAGREFTAKRMKE